MRVVIDCNVVVSAALTPGGTCRLALAEATRNQEILLSEAILAEYRDVAGRPKFPPIVRERLHALIEEIAARAVLIPDPVILTLPSLPDKDDLIYVIVAISADAEIIVTGNLAHFPEPSYGRALVVSAREFLDMTGE
jgi:putative PIN family toxin of toxin-antitoxin system